MMFFFWLFTAAIKSCSADANDYEGFADVHQMPFGRSDMSATVFDGDLFNDGIARIYLVGGCAADQICGGDGWCFCPEITNKCEFYKPDTDTWTDCADAPRERYRFAAAVVDGKLYLAGGRDVEDGLITAVDMYDPITDTWTTPFTWDAATSDNGMFSDGTDLYMVGGYNVDYSIAETALTKVSTVDWAAEAMAPMTVGRGDLGVISLNGLHYAIGGAAEDFCTMLATVESYDISSDTWSTEPELQLARADMALGVIGDSIFAIAGETKDDSCDYSIFAPGTSIVVSDVERYGDTALSWEIEEDVPTERFRFVGASFDEQIFLFGGQAAHTESLETVNGTTERVHAILDTTMLYVPLSIRLGDGDSPASASYPCAMLLGFLCSVWYAQA